MSGSLHRAFAEEAASCLARAEARLRSLDRRVGSADTGALIEIYRALHTITGMAGYLELESLREIARSAELLTDDLRVNRIHREGSRIDTLLRAVRRMMEMLACFVRDGSCGGDEQELIAAILAYIPRPSSASRPQSQEGSGTNLKRIRLGTQITTGPPRPDSIQAGIYE